MRELLSFLKWLVILFLIVGASFSVYVAVKLNQPATTESNTQDFEIAKGEHAGQIADRLLADGTVRNELILETYLRLKNAEDKLQAGIYILDSNLTIPEIVQILTQGKVKGQGTRITVVEGWGIRDIALRLEHLGLMQPEEFTEITGLPATNGSPRDFSGDFEFLKHKPLQNNLEGFLFPDTYLLKESATAEEVVAKMLSNFQRKIGAEVYEQAARQERDFYEVLILASIIEREVGRNFPPGTKLTEQDFKDLQTERRLVAGVFMNRLRLGMPLESDATINYVTGKKTPSISLEDSKIDSPYNTYKYRGLPPGPIGNPSLDSVKAAVLSPETDYLFFLSAPDGKAYFARTLSEHQQNRARYLK